MPEVVLGCGRLVTLDWDDVEWFQQRSWRAWKKFPDASPIIVCDEYRKKRSFRLRLLREVAVRARPELARVAARLTVRPLDGDHFNAQRSNLDVVVAVARPRQPATRPKGYAKGRRRRKFKDGRDGRATRAESPLWEPRR